MNPGVALPPAWAVLAGALADRRPIRARYRGTDRVLFPHALGWKHGRPKVLAYQSGGTSEAEAPDQRWRSMFIDEIDVAVIAEGPWQSSHNYSSRSNCFDLVEVAIPY